jgi:hypothetical protein
LHGFLTLIPLYGYSGQDFVETVIINEIAEQGIGPDVCGGEGYIELKNIGSSPIDPSGYFLFNYKNPDLDRQYEFPAGSASIDGGDFLLLCKSSFTFGFDRLDSVTLYNTVDPVPGPGPLPGIGSSSATYQRLSDGSGYWYAEPTPGRENVFQADSKAYRQGVYLVSYIHMFHSCQRANCHTLQTKSRVTIARISLILNCCIVRLHPLFSYGCRERSC